MVRAPASNCRAMSSSGGGKGSSSSPAGRGGRSAPAAASAHTGRRTARPCTRPASASAAAGGLRRGSRRHRHADHADHADHAARQLQWNGVRAGVFRSGPGGQPRHRDTSGRGDLTPGRPPGRIRLSRHAGPGPGPGPGAGRHQPSRLSGDPARHRGSRAASGNPESRHRRIRYGGDDAPENCARTGRTARTESIQVLADAASHHGTHAIWWACRIKPAWTLGLRSTRAGPFILPT